MNVSNEMEYQLQLFHLLGGVVVMGPSVVVVGSSVVVVPSPHEQ